MFVGNHSQSQAEQDDLSNSWGRKDQSFFFSSLVQDFLFEWKETQKRKSNRKHVIYLVKVKITKFIFNFLNILEFKELLNFIF